MKIIKNAKEARCTTCFVGNHAVFNDRGEVVCNKCGSVRLVDVNGDFVAVIEEGGLKV